MYYFLLFNQYLVLNVVESVKHRRHTVKTRETTLIVVGLIKNLLVLGKG